MSRISEALVAGRIGRLRAWWERFSCLHPGITDARKIQHVQRSNAIDAWTERHVTCARCGITKDYDQHVLGISRGLD